MLLPARTRIQRGVNRLLYGERDDLVEVGVVVHRVHVGPVGIDPLRLAGRRARVADRLELVDVRLGLSDCHLLGQGVEEHADALGVGRGLLRRRLAFEEPAQTAGVDNPDRNWFWRRLATGVTIATVVGFALVPIVFLTGAMPKPVHP